MLETFAELPADVRAQYPPAYVKAAEQMLVDCGEGMAFDPKYVSEVKRLRRLMDMEAEGSRKETWT
jgi:hypothetical protein